MRIREIRCHPKKRGFHSLQNNRSPDQDTSGKATKTHPVQVLSTWSDVSDFQTKIYSFDGPWDVVQENLPEMNVPFITGYPSFTPLTIGMERYGIHYAFSEEFVAEQFDFDIKKFVVCKT